jgi:hypothetical protein
MSDNHPLSPKRERDRMASVTVSLVHERSDREQACAICDAPFAPSEDSGSRLLSIDAADREPFTALMCGGCYSKWSHGMVTLHGTSTPPK